MQTYTTFASPDPAADADMASARVSGQDELLNLLRDPIYSDLLRRVESQENDLSASFRPIIADVAAKVDAQQQMLQAISEPLINRLNTLTAQQSAAMASVLGALPPEDRLALTTPDPRIRVDPYSPTEPTADYKSAITGIFAPVTEPSTSPVVVPAPETTSSTFVYDPVRPNLRIPSEEPLVPFTLIGPDGKVMGTPAPSPPIVPPVVPPTPTRPTTTTTTTAPGRPTVTTSTSGGCGPCPAPVVNVDVHCPEASTTPEEVKPRAGLAGEPIEIPHAPVIGPARPVVVAGAKWDTASPTLCRSVDEYVKAFARVGGEVRQFLFAGLNMISDLAGFIAKLKDINVIGPLFGVIADPASVLQKVFQEVGKMVIDYGGMFAGGNADALVGLYFTRGWCKLLENAELGINFVITGKVNLDLQPSQTIKIIDYMISYLHPVDVPALGTIDQMYLTDEITLAEAICLSKLQGRQENETKRNLHSSRTNLTPDLEVKYWQRWREPKNFLFDRLRRLGFLEEKERDRFIELGKFLPPPSDAIRFALRDVFDPQKLGLAEMKAEFQTQVGLKEMMAASGIEKVTIKDDAGKNLELDLPLLYFISSYEECSPTQVYEMLHRLRKNRVVRFPLPDGRGGFVNPQPVELDTVRSLLKEKDYNPIWRDRLAAISFHVPGRIDTRNMYRRGVFGKPLGEKGIDATNPNNPVPTGVAELELRERYMDMGYSEADSNTLALLDAREFDRLEGSKRNTKAMGRICTAYKLGGFTYEQALQQLINLPMVRKDAIEFLGGCDLDMRISDLKIAIAGVKKQWLDGAISSEQARDILKGYGVAQPRIDTYLSTWQLLRTVKHRELSAQQIATYWEEGLINLADARARLFNLGYDTTAINIILNHSRLGQLAKSTKERDKVLKAQQTEANRVAALLAKQQKEQAALEEKRMTRFLAGRSEKNLKEWLNDRTITEQEVRDTFTRRGWNPADIERWLDHNRPK